MQCYTNSLNKSPPNTHRVQKCLQKLLRSMHKDRHHTIQHFKHLLETSMEQADREKEITIEHLADIDRWAAGHGAGAVLSSCNCQRWTENIVFAISNYKTIFLDVRRGLYTQLY